MTKKITVIITLMLLMCFSCVSLTGCGSSSSSGSKVKYSQLSPAEKKAARDAYNLKKAIDPSYDK